MKTLADKILQYETDEMSTPELIEFFQELIDTGEAWRLQGHYGRMAKELIRSGYCRPKA